MSTYSWIAGLLDFERDGDVFIAPQWSGPGTRLFGGLIAAQALGAAGATVDPGKRPQSLHAYFVRGGRHGVDVELTGRAHPRRPVLRYPPGHRPPAGQGHPGDDRVVPASTSRARTGFRRRAATCVELDRRRRRRSPDLDVVDRFDLRCNPDDDSPFAVPPFWIRTRDADRGRSADPGLHVDLHVRSWGRCPAARPPGTPVSEDVGYAASLDHSVWFHRPFMPDAWHRYEVDSLGNSHSRGLVVGGVVRPQPERSIASTSQQASLAAVACEQRRAGRKLDGRKVDCQQRSRNVLEDR